MEYFNEMEVVFDSRSENEGFARVAVAAFMTQMDPVLEEVADVKTAVSEAIFIPFVSPSDQCDCVVHTASFFSPPVIFFIQTVVPFPGTDSTCTSSINASINANPIPDRSISGLVV